MLLTGLKLGSAMLGQRRCAAARRMPIIVIVVAATGAASVRAQDCRSAGSSGCRAYVAHLERARVGDADSIWRDLRYIASAEEMKEWFDTPGGDARKAFVDTFWRRRAARAALHAQERYEEHVRRLTAARARYGIAHPHPRIIGAFGYQAWFAPLLPVLVPPGRDPARYPLDLDDRGLFHLRYGEPDIVERCTGSVRPNARNPEYTLNEAGEAWIYSPQAPGVRPVILLFATRGRSSEYELVFTPGQTLCDYDQIERLSHRLAEFDAAFLHASKDDLLSARGYLAALVPWHHAHTNLDVAEFALDTELLRASLAADTALTASERVATPYKERVEAVVELLQFADYDSTGSAEVTLSVGLRASDMAVPGGPPQRYAARVVMTPSNAITGAAMEVLDTVIALRPATALPDSAVIAFHLLRTLPRGLYDYAVRLEPPPPGDDAPADTKHAGSAIAARGAVVTGRLDVSAASRTERLTISSIAVGRPARVSGWVREGSPLALAPNHIVPAGRQVALYYEVYGATRGDTVETSATVRPLGGGVLGRKPALSFTFREQAQLNDLGWLVAQRTIDVSQLAPGSYLLTITVACEGKGPVERRTTLYIPRGT